MATVAPEQEMLLDVRNPRTGQADFRLRCRAGRSGGEGHAAPRQPAPLGGDGGRGALRRDGPLARRGEGARADIGEADAVDTGGCHTSYIQGFITMGNIAGWLEDAPESVREPQVDRHEHLDADGRDRGQLVALPITGVISPWNAPLMLALLDAVPALFAGSAVLLKPSEVTPRVIETLFETVREVPELAAVFDYVTGPGEVGQAVIAEADTVCFTGSVPTGRKVAVACAERLIPCNLELGGKDPAIVTASADLDRAATAVLRGAVYATGQVCYSVERVYVHERVHDAFVARLVELANAVRLNADNPRAGHIGPFTFAPQAEIVNGTSTTRSPKARKIRTGGAVEDIGGGLYLRPTVLTGVTTTMLIMQDETFGPVPPGDGLSDTDEAIRLANDTQFGLTAR